MKIRNNFGAFAHSSRTVIALAAVVSLAGCNALGSLVEQDKVDYRSASKAPTLEVPPDLTQLQRDNRYAIPDQARGSATASSYNMQQGARSGAVASGQVLVTQLGDIRVERAGNVRWLVVKRAPEALWPQVKDFWQEMGFAISQESMAAGVMETDWAENRAKIPQDMVRNVLGKVLDSLYSSGERDKFRTRLERTADGGTEIYISHRGVQEVLTGAQKETSVWTPRAQDPALEAQFLARLMNRLGIPEDKAKEVVAGAAPQPAQAKLIKSDKGAFVEVNEGFDRAWRRVGLALDRAGFTVEDRDRVAGMYYVRYIDPEADAKSKTEKGFLSRLFSFGSSDKKDAPRYRVVVKSASGELSQVSVLNAEGREDKSATADKILALLTDQLK
ncbi:outer membrane protein assembly factor BamC [Massilia sp. W12]|uniref:outer membrane protein assembly factor BamC n=1 Tax=Massilia sp. W12 TaxID=3126507 RepID=UPI0030D533FE